MLLTSFSAEMERYLITAVILITAIGCVSAAVAGGGCNLSCPQPGDPDDYTICCTSNGVTRCCSWKLLAGILGGVFGGLALIGIIIATVCCVKVKKGDWVCLKVRPGKYTMVTRATYQRYMAQRQQAVQQRQQMEQRIAGLENIQMSQQQRIVEQNKHIEQLQGQIQSDAPPPAYDDTHRY